MLTSHATNLFKRPSPPTEEGGQSKSVTALLTGNIFRPSLSGAVCGKDVASTTTDHVFFFSTMAPKKVGHLTPSEEEETGHPDQPQCEERSLFHNAVITRPLPIVDVPPPED
ncbi:hypothetical protein ACLOJK_007401 [Asimina triloba]